jgi:hypothetical protein
MLFFASANTSTNKPHPANGSRKKNENHGATPVKIANAQSRRRLAVSRKPCMA